MSRFNGRAEPHINTGGFSLKEGSALEFGTVSTVCGKTGRLGRFNGRTQPLINTGGFSPVEGRALEFGTVSTVCGTGRPSMDVTPS
jgi:hypothetical protein